MAPIFITGGTGYIGKRLIKQLVAKGYDVTALTQKGSENKLPKGVRAIIADPFDASTFQQWIPRGAIYIQLLGVSHPSPHKRTLFRDVDLKSVKTSADAAATAGVSHFIYVSVAMSDGNIKGYQEVRKEGESYLLSKHLVCTFIRPWYVVGPGHLWPVFLLPFFRLGKMVSSQKKKIDERSFISIKQMIHTLIKAIDSPPQKLRVFEVKHIKRNSLPSI